MKSKIAAISAVMALMIALVLISAGCTEQAKTDFRGAQPMQALPQPPAPPAATGAADVPEIVQAEQSVQDIGTEELDETSSDIDELIIQ